MRLRKSKFKGLVMLSLAFVLFVSSLGFNQPSAKADTTIKSIWLEHEAHHSLIHHSLSTADSGADVKVSFVQGDDTTGYACNGCTFYWTMELQRYTSSGWGTIGTRTGYVEWGDPSHRTFTNVSIQNRSMRVKLTVTGKGVYYSNTWVR